ncbi:RagB/SusD family nutrient uptake outer membrane protein [Spirosoma sp. KCTC 42546]|uniref:RagB/SusD family nutrient uptake outer membrane protein n=1 Tax=Spirosoma sp. KCTC 42546 TaxID=2520506 RepID=UPI00115C12A1|nr:RagB/SusD family nutrient uptake outer membrane protein [Spirosoma sp. KCTC 42546]QDK81036.1 RagB/SusD family nutrient uptake outer membrane protein [Spirosoma sp. KCTC 42546]
MNSFRKLYLLLLAGTLTITQNGCNKVLDLDPLDQLSDASYWQTANDFMLAANQFYTYERTFADVLYDTNPNNAAIQNYHSDYKSDFLASQNPYSRGLNTVQTTDPNYSTDYTRIRNINYLLDKAQSYGNQAEIAKYVAEARFFRAYVYFDLLQIYGGVPIISKLLSTSSAELQAPRNTRDEVVDFILKDLNDAIAGLPAKTAQNAATELGRINKESAQSFLGRVALYEGTWQKFRNNSGRANTLLDASVAASGAVITGAQYQLFAPAALGDSAQKYMFILENQKSNPANITKTSNNEYILANRYDWTLRQIRNNVSRQANNANPTKNFANQYLSQDGLPIEKSPLFKGYATLNSEFANRDNRMQYSLKQANGYYWFGINNPRVDWTGGAADKATANASPFKPYANTLSGYANQKWISERAVADNEEAYDYPVIRYAEVLLNYAEAVFERNGTISDADLDKSLNLVRQRVNKKMPKLSTAFAEANGLDMRTEIRRERNVELFYEGFRVDDLKRWAAADVLKQPLVGVKWTGTEFQSLWPSQSSTAKDADGNIIVDGSRSFTDKNYLIPIPTQQIQLNPQLTQNPGW